MPSNSPQDVDAPAAPTPDQLSLSYSLAVHRNQGYDDALTDLREEIRGLTGRMPNGLGDLVREFFTGRIGDIAPVLEEADCADVLEGLEALSVECSSGPEGEGEVLLELYEHLHGLMTVA